MKRSIFCAAAILFSVLAKSQGLNDALIYDPYTGEAAYMNRIFINDKFSTYMNLGRGNDAGSSTNTYMYGYKNTMSTTNSTVVGYKNTLSAGSGSVCVFGKENVVGGHVPMAFGYRNYLDASSDKSIALGRDNTVYGYVNIAVGTRNSIAGSWASAFGNFNNASNTNSMALGYKNNSTGSQSFAAGAYSTASGMGSSAVGYSNNVSATYAFAFGYGITNNIPSSVMIGTNNSSKLTVLNNGNVLIAKTVQQNPTYKLDVNGNVRANQVVVNTTGADFVFDSSYKLAPLTEVEKFVASNRHLPGIAPASEMQGNGMDIGEQQTKHLQKLEELTLYLIDQSKKIEALQAKVEQQQQEIEKLRKRPSRKK